MITRLKTIARRGFDTFVREQEARAARIIAQHDQAGRIARESRRLPD